MMPDPGDTTSAEDANRAARPLAVVTGASTGIGLELARCAARDFDLLIVADEPAIHEAANELAVVARPSQRWRLILPASRASTDCSRRPANGPSMPSSPMPAEAWAGPSPTRISKTSGV